MSRKEKVTRQHLRNDTAKGPNITRLLPLTALEYDFRRSVLSSVNDRAMLLSLVGRSSEVDQFYFFFGWQQDLTFFLEFIEAKKDVLRLEISMNIAMSMYKSHCLEELLGKRLYLPQGVPLVFIPLDDVEEGRPKGLKDHAVMLKMIK